MIDLCNKIAIVTGGSSGIGLAIAKRFANDGAIVYIVGRNESTLKKACDGNPTMHYIVGDLTKSDVIQTMIKTIETQQGRLDILVNNAGWCPVKSIKDMTIDDYDHAFQLDVRALVELTIAALPLLLRSKGNIINLSSVGSTHRSVNLSMYQGAKAAVDNFTRVWALELANDGVRVNAIGPGAIMTNIWSVPGLSEQESKAHQAHIAASIPVGYFGDPEDIADMAEFLVSDQAKYITGAIMAVDGGMGAL